MKPSKTMSLEERKELKKRLEKLAWLSDSSIKLPGNFKVGLDSIIGLIPVVGDFSSALMSFYIMFLGLRAKVPKLVIFRMSLTILWDTTIGAIPVIGDIYDMFFKSNERNVSILTEYLDAPEATEQSTRWWLVLLILFLAGNTLVFLWLMWQFVQWSIGLF